jgi:hypothetical protein
MADDLADVDQQVFEIQLPFIRQLKWLIPIEGVVEV